ncbi:uncharacterized protein [Prorops nasuta]|uniref:uncharacterized protein n=1 Tax=Prorops nasuta TaxID=863751 RepID=UPI0034CF7D9F
MEPGKGPYQPPPPGFVPSSGHPPPPGYPPNSGFAPPPPYNDPGVPQQTNVVIIQAPNFGSEPQRLLCPYCRAEISTRVESDCNTKTHLFALGLCLLGFWCCIPCPYCMDTCLVKKHYCPACKEFLGQSEN